MPPAKAYIFLALCTLFWSGNAVAGKLAVGHVSPMLLTNLRWVIATALLLAIGTGQLRRDWGVLRPKLGFVIVLGALGFAAFNLLFYAAANYTEAINISLVQAGIPAVIFILSFVIFRLTASKAQLLGFVLSLAGVAIAASRGDLSNLLQLALNRGDLLMLIAISLYGGYAVALRYKPEVHWQSLMIVMAMASLFVTTPFAVWEWQSGAMIMPDLQGWLIILYTAIFPAILAQVFFMGGVEIIGANRAGLFVNLVPVAGTILSVLVIGEVLYGYHAVALLLVICGIVLAESSSRRQDKIAAQ